ncbi:MAG: AMIN domain-containing protein, partial [Myxococcota bacterium]|nr:AMIN domain-containing protein [Myxococcota bacterium]
MVKRRTQAGARIAFFGAVVLLCLISPLSAQAAQVVDLRIGVHPDYTRVVFELDRPAAYKVERGSGQAELVVSLDAESIARKVKPSNSLIDSIRLEPTATGSQARIALTRDGLNLKEMILANPPRIVLDVIVPEGELAKAPVAAPKAAAPTRSPAPKPRAKAAAPKKPAKIIAAAAPVKKVGAKRPAKTAPAATAKPIAKDKATPTPTPTLALALKPPPRLAPSPAVA